MSEDVGNNGGTTVGGVTGKGWQKGQSGNPQGRPKRLASQIRGELPPEEWMRRMLEAADDPKARPADKIAVLRDLADRAYGKAPTHTPLEGLDPLEVDEVAAEISRIADDLRQRREERAA